MLQTTAIDPGAAFGGYVFADQLLISEGTRRQVIVEVNFTGSPHRFTLNLVPSGTDFPVPVGIPATPRQTVQALQHAPETWHWTGVPPSSKVDGMTVIE
ncbi:hypothetical protein [Brevundimonas nasdae]|uniref:Uncharacterized protein n=1 Tax=Brevundimonas nasdae TaxID=172043 RepID=A0ABX8TL08_9CAUL|nr:hypothetical protein [Brevundimonas nasdae]QYC09809.1 hypothetical protein KWG56_14715 [Brevundimonas nasdae]QYC12598.1 hypothetical protein KWG63_10035 [Brevundimonas nasdae]